MGHTHKNTKNVLACAERLPFRQRLTRAIATHGMILEAIIMSTFLGVILSDVQMHEQAYFLYRSPATHRLSTFRTPDTLTLQERARQRRIKRVMQRRKTVAQNPLPFIVDESVHTAAPVMSSASSSGSTSVDAFPAFGHAAHPVSRVPDWGAMKTPAEWNRTYRELDDSDFVRVPPYNLQTLTIPMQSLLQTRDSDDTVDVLTQKLYYSTRYFGAYDLDSGEFTAVHPGLDLKLAEGTPVGAVAGGRVHDVRRNDGDLGLHVLIEHRAPDGNIYYSVYAHLGSVSVQKGDGVRAGQGIGTVGMSGNTTAPHLHLQIDRGEAGETYHEVYWPETVPSRAQADQYGIHPIVFLRKYADGE